MKLNTIAATFAAALLVGGCKIQIVVPEGGSVASQSNTYTCSAGSTCEVDIVDGTFDEVFVATPADGFEFAGWKARAAGLCGGPSFSSQPCRVATTSLMGDLLAFVLGDFTVFLEPEFVVFDETGVAALLETNADIALAAYSDSLETAQALQTAIEAFAQNPTQANLDAAKQAWLVAREPYGQTEVYRFRLSPIDSTDYTEENGPEGEINAWPLGEALIDYVTVAEPDFGFDQIGIVESSTPVNDGGQVDGLDSSNNIIGNANIVIDRALLDSTFTAEDERDVIAGYHAIEFMLWGQDLNGNAMVTNGTDRIEAVKTLAASNIAAGGQRPLTDFTSDPFASRRLTFLQVAAQKLIDDLQSVVDGWQDGVEGNYRDQFTSFATRDEAVQRITEILTGMGTLSEGELAGERMQIAYSANSQEDEHSCFSDNTHRDMLLNALGISNSYFGAYAGYDSDLDGMVDETARAVDGFGFDDYATELNVATLTEIVTTLEARLSETSTNMDELDAMARNGMPFDVLIQDAERDQDSPIFKAIISLNQQSISIADLAERLAIDVDVVDDDASECDTTNPDQTCG
ncbi:MAG: imelysin family protein [Pseudomonadota bacterium]